MKLNLKVTKKQKRFIDANENEVLFGGAAGGGKSYGQLVDAFVFGLRYPGSKQLIFRRTFSELEKSLIRVANDIYPRSVYKYNSSKHTGVFRNGSIIDFGYCDRRATYTSISLRNMTLSDSTSLRTSRRRCMYICSRECAERTVIRSR